MLLLSKNCAVPIHGHIDAACTEHLWVRYIYHGTSLMLTHVHLRGTRASLNPFSCTHSQSINVSHISKTCCLFFVSYSSRVRYSWLYELYVHSRLNCLRKNNIEFRIYGINIDSFSLIITFGCSYLDTFI